MLSTRFSFAAALRAMAAAMALGVLAACATSPAGVSEQGVAVDVSQPVPVALLVPLGSGDPGRELIGRSLVNAGQLAQADLQNAAIDLRIYPTSGTPEGGAAAANQAVAEGAKIIVGPLFSTATAGAQGIAASAGLKVLSLSNNPEVAGGNTYIVGNTFFNTANRLVGFGLSRGLRSYGVVYPFGLEGETARDAVAASVRARGGDVVASEGYNLSVESIRSAAVPAAAALAGSGANAVVLTDGPTGGLAIMSAALRENGLTASQAQFLGLQRWDVSAEVLAEPSLQGGVFAAPDPGLIAAFEGRYRNAYGEAPHELAGLAYDGVAAVGAMIAVARAGGGSPFTDARITDPAGFAGVNGAFRFLPGGLNQRNLAMFEVRGGQAVVIERAAGSFGGTGG